MLFGIFGLGALVGFSGLVAVAGLVGRIGVDCVAGSKDCAGAFGVLEWFGMGGVA